MPSSSPGSGPKPGSDPAGAAPPGLGDPAGVMALWASWAGTLNQMSRAATAAAGAPATEGADQAVGAMLAANVAQLREALMGDPTLRALDQLWNANPLRELVPVDWGEIARSLRLVWLGSLEHPAEAAASLGKLNASLWQSALDSWADASRRWLGLPATPPAVAPAASARADKRFAAPEWQSNPAFRTLRDLYWLASDWLIEQGGQLAGPAAERERLSFHLRQFIDATSPSLLLMCNPTALRRAVETGGGSLADGLRNLRADRRDGRLSMVDATAFEPGRNLALTPGKVVHRSALVELIQYTPATKQVHAVPLLILPPWINKYYIMDMQPKNSMIGWLVAQGFSVFVVSWKNPDAGMDGTSFEDYLRLGCLETSDIVREITGAARINVMGYCIGGTLLAMSLAWLAARGDERFLAATFIVSLQDFSNVGDTARFLGEEHLDFVEQQMLERGYLDSREMSNMFNLLRSNDLIWANVVNNYLMGEKPAAFDLLYWNSDGTRMTRAAHSWYLRQTYAENNLIRPGAIELAGETLDLSRVTLDVYAVGAEKDHIVPWPAAWQATRLFGGEIRYVLASSGHVAGIINPPDGKGAYWTSAAKAETAEAWRAGASRADGSWWTDWAAWLAARSGPKVRPPKLGSKAHPALMDAPGSYVLEK